MYDSSAGREFYHQMTTPAYGTGQHHSFFRYMSSQSQMKQEHTCLWIDKVRSLLANLETAAFYWFLLNLKNLQQTVKNNLNCGLITYNNLLISSTVTDYYNCFWNAANVEMTIADKYLNFLCLYKFIWQAVHRIPCRWYNFYYFFYLLVNARL